MSIRAVGAVAAFLMVFLGLMSMVGNVAVEEFYGCLVLGFVAGIVAFLKLPKPSVKNTNL